MIRWMGRLVPMEWLAGFVMLCALAYFGPYLLELAFSLAIGNALSQHPGPDSAARRDGVELVIFLLRSGALIYGAFRAIAFTPFQGRAYYRQLLATPYDGTKPLLAGPLLPAYQDGVLILLGESVSFLLGYPLGLVLTLFVLPHVLIVSVLLLDRRIGSTCLLLVMVLLSLQSVHTPWRAAVLACLAAVLEWYFVRQDLREFPWQTYGATEDVKAGQDSASDKTRAPKSAALPSQDDEKREGVAGWPLGNLAPQVSARKIGFGNAVAMGAIFGLAAHSNLVAIGGAGLIHLSKDQENGILGIAGLLLLPAIFVRVRVYVGGYRPPITLFGRLASGRLIIPSYDVVFATPLAALLTFFLMLRYFSAHVPFEWLLPLASGLTLAILLGGPPSMAEWRCTGHHRIVVSGKRSGRFIQT
jgi:hypothetical protein